MKQLAFLFFAIGLVFVGVSSTNAQWQLISSNSANSDFGRETFYVGSQKGRFDELELRVSGAPFQIQRAEVHFANGKTRRIYMPGFIRNGGSSGPIYLPGGQRAIAKVVIWGRAFARPGGRATLRLYGRGWRSW